MMQCLVSIGLSTHLIYLLIGRWAREDKKEKGLTIFLFLVSFVVKYIYGKRVNKK